MIKPQELQLCSELAHAILLELLAPHGYDLNAPGPDKRAPRDLSRFKRGAIFDHAFQGYFEGACLSALHLGLAEGVDADGRAISRGSDLPYHYKLLVEPHEIGAVLAARAEHIEISLEAVLEAFVGIAVGHWATLPSAREAFSAPEEYRRLMNHLCIWRYAEKVGLDYRWLDKIAPAMQANWLWGDAMDDNESRWRAERDEEVKQALSGLPPLLRARLARAAAEFSELEFAKLLSRHWDGESWRPIRMLRAWGDGSIPSRFLEFSREIQKLVGKGSA